MSGNYKILSHLLMVQLPRSHDILNLLANYNSSDHSEIMAGKKEGDPLEIYFTTDVYLGNFLKWLDPSKRSIILYAKNLREAIAREEKLLANTL